jgi:hypothetical protein
MFERVNNVTSKGCPTSHLFSCKTDNLKVLGHWIFFPFLDFGQTYGSNGLKTMVEAPLPNIWRAHPRGYFTCGNMSSPTKLTRVHLGFSKNKKPTSPNVSVSIWMRSIPSYTSHKANKAYLLSAYIMLVLPTQNIRSSWQNQNLYSSIDTTLATN